MKTTNRKVQQKTSYADSYVAKLIFDAHTYYEKNDMQQSNLLYQKALQLEPTRHPCRAAAQIVCIAVAEQVRCASVILRRWVYYFWVGNSSQVFQNIRWYLR